MPGMGIDTLTLSFLLNYFHFGNSCIFPQFTFRKIFVRFLEIAGTSTPNNSAIPFWESQIVSSFKMAFTFISLSSTVYNKNENSRMLPPQSPPKAFLPPSAFATLHLLSSTELSVPSKFTHQPSIRRNTTKFFRSIKPSKHIAIILHF